MTHRKMACFVWLMLAACEDHECATDAPRLDAGRCVDASFVSMMMAVPAQLVITSDLVVHGSLRVPPTVSVSGVFVGVRTAATPATPRPLPPGTIAAVADTSDYLTWHATVPLGVLLAPLPMLPGNVEVVAMPGLNCAIDPDIDPSAIAASGPLMVNNPQTANAATFDAEATKL